MRGAMRWSVIGVLVVVAAVSAGLVLWSGLGKRPGSASDDPRAPIAVVLDARKDASDLVVVDLARRRVVRRIALRSFVGDIALDASSGIVVAAQSGGIAEKADDAVSLTDPRTGRVRYVKLAFPNPALVACVAGRAYVVHGLLQARGLASSVVEVGGGRLVGTGHAPDGPGLWSAFGDAIWTAVVPESGQWAVARVEPSTLATSLVDVGGFRASAMASSGRGLVLAGTAGGGSGGAAVARLDPSGTAVEASAGVAGLGHPASAVVCVGPRLVVSDWSGEPPESGLLAVLDAETLRPEAPLTSLGEPCALAAWGDLLVAVDRSRGRLLIVDPATRRTLSGVDLGVRDMVFSDVVVLGPS